MRYWLAIGIGLVFSLTGIHAQESVFIYSLNDPPEKISHLLEEEHEVLLKHYDGNMKEAIQDWYGLLSSLESYADAESVDLNGIKVWLNVYFRPDGTIKAIGYYPKGGCKKMEWPVFEALLKEFSKQYQFPVKMEQSFSHYAAAMWPVEMLNR